MPAKQKPTAAAKPAKTNTPDFSAGGSFAKVTDDPNTVNELVIVAPPAKKEIRRPLKPRDIRFVEAKVKNPDTPNYKAAMIATGTTDMNVASTQAARMLHNVTLRETIDVAMDKMGYSIDGIIEPVKDALEYTDPDGDERAQLDIRLKGHDRAMKLLMIISGDDKTPGGNTFNFIGQNNFVKKDAA